MASKKLIPLVIDRTRWARGGMGGMERLLNRSGNMCCLGFACRVLAPRSAIRDLTMPSNLLYQNRDKPRMVRQLAPLASLHYSGARDTQWARLAQRANDNAALSEPLRERKVARYLKNAGFAVKFVGKKGVVRKSARSRKLIPLKPT